MPLILAVEPDRRRGRQLASLVRRFTKAEIIVAQSGAAAIPAVGDRVPDLILTPALLSTQDEQVIATWLRDLGDVAAHVQTLAIPILAETEGGAREEAAGSIIGKLLDRGDAGSSHGCDPSVFADQIKVYLDRASKERAVRGDRPIAVAPEPAAPPAPPAPPAKQASSDDLDFEEISLDSLVLEPLFIDTPAGEARKEPEAPAPVEPPAPEPKSSAPAPSPSRAATRPAAAPKPVAARELEQELGVGRRPDAAPALWRVSEGLTDEGRTSGDWAHFDPSTSRFRALAARLDDIARGASAGA